MGHVGWKWHKATVVQMVCKDHCSSFNILLLSSKCLLQYLVGINWWWIKVCFCFSSSDEWHLFICQRHIHPVTGQSSAKNWLNETCVTGQRRNWFKLNLHVLFLELCTHAKRLCEVCVVYLKIIPKRSSCSHTSIRTLLLWLTLFLFLCWKKAQSDKKKSNTS